MAIVPNNLNNTGSLENWEPVLEIKSAKKIAGEERDLHFFDSIRPAFAAFIEGQELFVSHAAKMASNTLLIARAHLQRIPRVTVSVAP
jgi:hypothetical protein